MTIEQRINELRTELKACIDVGERRQIEAELEIAQAELLVAQAEQGGFTAVPPPSRSLPPTTLMNRSGAIDSRA